MDNTCHKVVHRAYILRGGNKYPKKYLQTTIVLRDLTIYAHSRPPDSTRKPGWNGTEGKYCDKALVAQVLSDESYDIRIGVVDGSYEKDAM